MVVSTIDPHPLGDMLRTGMMPHLWCSGCGIGVVLNAFLMALSGSGIPSEKVVYVCGIGCSGRAGGYVNLDAFHTAHGRAIPFATGLKLANPELTVVVFGGDGDLAAIGGNHLMHAARRNMDLLVICVNNFNYGMTGGQVSPTTPLGAKLTTAPYGSAEPPFNLPLLVDICGATYVARWTTYHVRQLQRTLAEALRKKGFRFIEVISPCPTLYERRNRLGDGLDRMKFYHEKTEIRHGADTRELGIDFDGPIIAGKFVDRERDSYKEAVDARLRKALGDRYAAS